MVIAEQIKGTYIIGLLQGYLMDEDTITDWIEQLQSELVLMSNRLLLVSKIEVVAPFGLEYSKSTQRNNIFRKEKSTQYK